MLGSTLPSALTKTYCPTFVDLRKMQREEKIKNKNSLCTPLSLLFLTFLFFFFVFIPFIIIIIIIFFSFFLNSFISFYCIINYVANCEPQFKCIIWLLPCVTSWGAIWHLTLYASKNVQFRLFGNSTKFNGVARFRETI